MCWVAFDRAIKSVEQYGLEGPSEHWKELRRQIASRSSTRLRPRAQHLRAILRRARSRRLAAADPAARVPAARRPAGARHDRGDRARADAGRAGLPLSEPPGGRSAAGRGRVSRLQLLAGQQPVPDRPARRGDRAVRAAAGVAQRPWPDVGRIRPEGEAAARQFPAGLLAYRDHQYRGASGGDRDRRGQARQFPSARRRQCRPPVGERKNSSRRFKS